MNNKYSIWLVPNGRLADFEAGHTASTYPNGCRCFGSDLTLEDCKTRFRELAEENFRREEGEYDHISLDVAAELIGNGSDDDAANEAGLDAADAELAKYLNEVTDGNDPTMWSFEWNNDLKYVRVKAERIGRLFSCDKNGNNAEPVCPNEEPATLEEMIYGLNANAEDEITYREATIDDECVNVDIVAENADGEIIGYFKFV